MPVYFPSRTGLYAFEHVHYTVMFCENVLNGLREKSRVCCDVTDSIRQNSENKPRGLYFSKGLFEWHIFGGAYIRRGLSSEGNLRFKIDWASLIVGGNLPFLFCFTFDLRHFSKYKPPGSLYLEGRFNGGFFALPVCGAYT